MTTEQPKEEIKYRVKIVTIGSRSTPIILQNYNGPCPLIAVANALLLQGKRLGIDPNQKFVSNDHLLQILATFLLEYNPTKDDTQESEPVNISIQEALEVLPKIKDGLDVNVRFNGITSFESRPEVELFNLLKLKLVHGWIIDPQDAETASVLDDLTYNQAIEKFLLMEDLVTAESKASAEENTKEPTQEILLSDNASPDNIPDANLARTASDIGELIRAPDELRKLDSGTKERIIREGKLIGEFLDQTRSQLTVYGLTKLHEGIKDNNLSILFRNNHFSTVCKYKDGHLYQLCTDEGFADEPNVVWERISEVLGDNQLFKGDFQPYNFANHASNKTVDAMASIERTNNDFELAVQLQREEEQREKRLLEQERSRAQQPQMRQQHVQQQQPPQQTFSNTRQPIDTGVAPPSLIPSIREKRDTTPKANSNPNRKYENQAKSLQELNKERQIRAQQMPPRQQPQTQTSTNPPRHHHGHHPGHRKKEDHDGCSVM
jgi:hypothetical protein